jgi:C4-dicarboxylate-binding protein DctP
MTKRRTFIGMLGGAAIAMTAAGSAFAQEVTLKLEHFLPAQANVPTEILDVWANNLERNSNGRVKIERYATMSLGGTPPELIDHVQDGIVDIGWVVVGYTPGRYPTTEVFELPFMVEDADAASYALWKMHERHMADSETKDLKILGTWVHGPGMFHSADPIETPGDLEGMKIRGGSRLVNQLLEAVGATPVGMPVPAVAEALSKGVIDGTTIPWEVSAALKVPELVENHTQFEGPALYTLTFFLAMNKDKFDSLPADIQEMIDNHSGLAFSIFAGSTQQDADWQARAVAEELGNNIITISDTSEWRELVAPIYGSWIADMDAQGKDGQALIDEAKALMAEYSGN